MTSDRTISRRDFAKTGVLGLSGLALAPTVSATAAPRDALAEEFLQPPAAAKPHTLWHWMDGNVSKEGITADLEAMQRIGLGGAMIFSIGYDLPQGPVGYASPQWRAMITHAAQEAKRLGLELGLHNSSGWSSTGGPWISPDLAMQKLVWNETRVHGPARLVEKLQRPEAGKYASYYRDIAVVAVPTPEAEHTAFEEYKVTLSTSLPGDVPQTFGGRTATLAIALPTPNETPQHIALRFDRRYTARSLCLTSVAGHGAVTCVLETSDDGVAYRPATTFVLPRRGMPNVNFPPVSARFFRLSFTGEVLDTIPFVISNIDLGNGYRLPDWASKSGFALADRFTPCWDEICPQELCYPQKKIVEITEYVDDGTLTWDIPPGDWTILRFGYAPTGSQNIHPEPDGAGLEVDKMSAKALDAHFKGLLDNILDELGPLAGQSLKTIVIDSYEVGAQNWTGAFRKEFRSRCGYDIGVFLPALTGRVIDNPETTERVLWDMRRIIAALFTENYYGHFRTRCHERGLTLANEPYIGPFSPMDCAGAGDLAIAEFWTGNLFPENKSVGRRVISSAHIAGRPLVGAEAFTSRYDIDRFSLDPAALKSDGDAQFCEGITRFIFHRFAHQPWLNRSPGMTMGPYGLHFDRTATWWEPGRAWIEYLTRSQYLLQTGTSVADVLCFDGEDNQAMSRWNGRDLPAVPPGYDFDFISAAYLLKARVENGFVTLDSGVRYRVLALPDLRHATLPIVRKIAELVKGGAIVVGAPPQRTPNYGDQASAAEFARIVSEVWGNCDGKTVTRHSCGNGTAYWGLSLAEVLAEISLAPDFEVIGSAPLRFKHRRIPGIDIFFVSNQSQQRVSATCRFRTSGRVPEIWNPETGIAEPAALYRQSAADTEVLLTLEPTGSVFIVFRHLEKNDHAVRIQGAHPAPSLTRSNRGLILEAASAGRYEITTAKGRTVSTNIKEPPPALDISTGWTVTFPENAGAPPSVHLERLASLSQHSEPGVRYFSGTAIYTNDVDVPAALLHPSHEIYLDLGIVKNLARVRINGRDLGVLWKAPFRCVVTPLLRPGRNHLRLEVTNMWGNRLIGDEQLPDDCAWLAVPDRGARIKEWPRWFVENTPRPSGRITFTTWKFYRKDDALPDSGLIGPTRLVVTRKVLLHP